MKTINNNAELMSLSFSPVKRALKRWYLLVQLRAVNRHIDVVDREINNGHRAMAALAKDRATLLNRIRGT